MDLDYTDKALLRSMSRVTVGAAIANTAGNKLHADGENNQPPHSEA
jgi:hypothetical protein